MVDKFFIVENMKIMMYVKFNKKADRRSVGRQ